ncbi:MULTISPECIES: hypothetical protein [unclassified Dyella]|uniref:hypothetical protein n=1 Tax=Dyella sp. ASV21 TaxID=2795114 RepID=UPI0018EC1C17|nr:MULTISPECIES: hypothetical protein [unclassified Dyella]
MLQIGRSCAIALAMALGIACFGISAQTAPSDGGQVVSTQTIALSAAQTQTTTGTATSDGDALLANKPNVGYAEGGEAGTGTVTLNGQTVDMNRLAPTTTDKSYIDRLKSTNNGKDLNDLKTLYDTESKKVDKDTGAMGQASNTVSNSAANKPFSQSDLENDPTLKGSASSFDSATNGNALGDVFGDCKDTTVVTPVQEEGYIIDYKTCDKVLTPTQQGVVCTRTRHGSVTIPRVPGQKDAQLLVEQGATMQMCTRKTTAYKYRETLHQTRDGDLNVTQETGGLSCKRVMSASTSQQKTQGSAQGDLPISTEMGSVSCQRTVYSTTVSQPGQSSWYIVNDTTIPSRQELDQQYDFSTPDYFNLGYTVIPANARLSNAWITDADQATVTNLRWSGTTLYYHLVLNSVRHRAYRINYQWTVDAVGAGVSESGWCGDPGSAQCPTQWRCDAYAPYWVNGQQVTADMASSKAPLFPGAGSTCVVGTLSRTCGGSATNGAAIPIGDKVPAGATYGSLAPKSKKVIETLSEMVLPIAVAGEVSGIRVSNFQWWVSNPQNGVSVWLTQTPTQANGWVAGFSVSRSDFSYVPQQPHIVMTWDVTTSVTDVGVGDQGNCNDPGSTACPTQWSCTQQAPATVSGLYVSASLAQSKAPLYPGAPNTCVVGELNRVCNGASNAITSIGIGDLLPPGATEISAFNWYVTNPDGNVSVALTAAPTLANGWTASFNVRRQYTGNGSTAVKPHIHMTWDVLGPEKIAVGTQDTGDCNASPESPSCKMAWHCTQKSPGDIDGIHLEYSDLYNGGRGQLYPGEGYGCLVATYNQECSGTGGKRTSVSIADQIKGGVKQIYDYTWTVSLPIANVTVKQIQAPTFDNGWIAIFETTRQSWADEPPGQPTVHLQWNQDGDPQYGFSVEDSGDCTLHSDQFCKVNWTCDQRAPVVVNGLTIPAEIVQQQPPLFDGDGGTCMVATLHYDCSGIYNSSGDVCWDDDDGTRHCMPQEPADGQPNSCQDIESDPTCTLKSKDCADGGMGDNGWCYIETYQYACKKGVPITDHNVTETTQCSANNACLDGSCTSQDKKDEASYSRNKALAKQVETQHVMNDWTIDGAAPTGATSPTQGPAPQSMSVVPAWANPTGGGN